MLGRTPTQVEIDYWAGHLDAGRTTRGLVMLGFSESDEYKAKINKKVFVTMIYMGMLRRAPEPAGLDYWVDAMNQGSNPLVVIEQVLNSGEYRNRFLPPLP